MTPLPYLQGNINAECDYNQSGGFAIHSRYQLSRDLALVITNLMSNERVLPVGNHGR